MTRYQIQLPDPLAQQLKGIAGARDLSFAEVCRRGLERYAEQWATINADKEEAPWAFPVLPANAMDEDAALNRQESLAADLRTQ